ncbi:helix-turn-helix transcriptional regulator [Thermomonas brevis]|uniref:Helix-turn-helix transcriptional regulator n=1 Tax=Thermomonas brevis TaxID=215691 RepID=A0A7G9QQE4_9GAMM|nr:helix-turn-helix transcriptional regulator [Thermomonas brevis]QNN45569.1 helix-turn-helix transcriptional regulator [Thermomonas brevis]
MSDSPPRAVFAARLIQARQLRGLSQRALGDRMGLGKDTGSTRINRYEQQASAISFDSLIAVAQALDVPPAYLLADSPEMADAILALSGSPALARLVQVLRATPELADAALRLAELPNEERDKALAALRALPR